MYSYEAPLVRFVARIRAYRTPNRMLEFISCNKSCIYVVMNPENYEFLSLCHLCESGCKTPHCSRISSITGFVGIFHPYLHCLDHSITTALSYAYLVKLTNRFSLLNKPTIFQYYCLETNMYSYLLSNKLFE